MGASFGIDHPLIAVNKITTMREQFIAMGFNMTPIGKHPWGTNTTLAMFDSCLIEIVSVYDVSLLHEKPAGDFLFGQHVYDHLQIREGIALSALHSTAIKDDIKHAEKSGMLLSGSLEFGRDVNLPDGSSHRTKTSLALLPNALHPRLSFFLCQQHKPELIYVPEWLIHPNTVHGYSGISIRAEIDQQAILKQQLTKLYGHSKVIDQGFSVETANGSISVQNLDALEKRYFALPEEVSRDEWPAIVALDFKCKELSMLEGYLQGAEVVFQKNKHSITLSEASATGNTIFRFMAQ